MLTKNTKWSAFIYLLIGLLLGFGASKVAMVEKVKDPSENTAPIRIVEIAIDPRQEEQLFTQIRKFANEWEYAIRIAPTDQFGKDFIIEMWRLDIKLFGVYPSDPGELKIAFYHTNPAVPVPEMFFDTEIKNMKKYISEIPDATFNIK